MQLLVLLDVHKARAKFLDEPQQALGSLSERFWKFSLGVNKFQIHIFQLGLATNLLLSFIAHFDTAVDRVQYQTIIMSTAPKDSGRR
jgi:hypothetical protein